jgi:hypothetical protein
MGTATRVLFLSTKRKVPVNVLQVSVRLLTVTGVQISEESVVEVVDAEDEAAAFTAGARVVGAELLVLSLETGEEVVLVTVGVSTGIVVEVVSGVGLFVVFEGVPFLPTIGI